MHPKAIRADATPAASIASILETIHLEGPGTSKILETISLYKLFHSEVFAQFEERIVSAMGLYYKIGHPESLYAFLVSQFGSADIGGSGRQFTPVQSSIRRAIEENQFISVSAPTSAGKSYSIRDFVASDAGDAVVVVPSRALIAEYLSAMRASFGGDKGVMVLPFVDKVYTSRNLRRIFVLTPERARDLFDFREGLNVTTFFFDEAQISEEPNRGAFFDVLVRRVRDGFPNAKLIFAHPFVENPEAQLQKHQLEHNAISRAYKFGAVGKVYVFRHGNGRDYFFSPFEEDGVVLKKCEAFVGAFDQFAFGRGHSVLAYVTKSSIYDGSFLDDFRPYVESFPEVENPKALELIEAVQSAVGADQPAHKSLMVDLLRLGVVIHHGSVPLEVRFLLEEFVRSGFARICFATSTLVQGVNMPFDIVWLDSMRIPGDVEARKALSFKNLIGRAGRLSQSPGFDFGYVFTKNPKVLARRLHTPFELSQKSQIDEDSTSVGSDPELLASIREGSFNEELHLPQSKADRLAGDPVMMAAEQVLDHLFSGESVRASMSGNANRIARVMVAAKFREIYEAGLGRRLGRGEQAIFDQAIQIMLQVFGGRSFREIVGTRFSWVSRRDEGRSGESRFTQRAAHLPDISLKSPFPLIPQGTDVRSVSYDAVMFDTYDYLDEVISFCLKDTLVAAFKVYLTATSDERASRLIGLLRYGTDDPRQILLMRYGFLPDDIPEILPHVRHIDESRIEFDDAVHDGGRIASIVSWYT